MKADYFLAHRAQAISCWLRPGQGIQLKAQALDRVEIVNTEAGTELRCDTCRSSAPLVAGGFTAIVHRADCDVMGGDDQPVQVRTIPCDWLQSEQSAEVVR